MAVILIAASFVFLQENTTAHMSTVSVPKVLLKIDHGPVQPWWPS